MANNYNANSANLTMQPSRAASQQPMSLVTVDASGANLRMANERREQSDLLTLRILEASERKMQLIKKLLSPEEFGLLVERQQQQHQQQQADLTSSDLMRRSSLDEASRRMAMSDSSASSRANQQQSNSISANQFRDDKDDGDQFKLQLDRRRKRLSRSEANLGAGGRSEANNANIGNQVGARQIGDAASLVQENLHKKREALDFFFKEQAKDMQPVKQEAGQLAIELRNGHYFRSMAAASAGIEHKLLKQGDASHFINLDRLLGGLLSLFNWRSARQQQQQAELSDSERQFVALYSNVACTPYNGRHNLLKMHERLVADGHLEKIMPMNQQQQQQKQPIGVARGAGSRQQRAGNSNEPLDGIDFGWCGGRFGGGGGGAKLQLVASNSNQASPIIGGAPSIACSRAAQDYKPNILYELLEYHPIVQWIDRQLMKVKAIKLTKLSSIERRAGRDFCGLNRFGSMELRAQFEQLAILRHPELMSSEELQSNKLLDLHEELEKLGNDLMRVKTSLVGAFEEVLRDEQSLANCYYNSLIMQALDWLELNGATRLRSRQRELAACWAELESIRAEQGFSSTNVRLKCLPRDANSSSSSSSASIDAQLRAAVEECKAILTQLKQQQQRDSGASSASMLSKLEAFLACQAEQHQEQLAFEISSGQDDDGAAPKGAHGQSLPASEIARRRQLSRWMKSLLLRLQIDDKYYEDIQLVSPASQIPIDDYPSRRFGCFELQGRQPQLRAYMAKKPSCQLRVELRSKANRFAWSKVLASGSIQIELNSSRESHSIRLLSAPDSSEPKSIEACLRLRCSLIEGHAAVSTPAASDCSTVQSTISDRLYDRLFTAKHPLASPATKCHQILNRIDHELLAALLGPGGGGGRSLHSSRRLFVLDPFADRLLMEAAGATLADPEPIRFKLLSWRWLNRLQLQQVFLSERENINAFRLDQVEAESSRLLANQMQKLKPSSSQLSGGAGQTGWTGFQLIERRRQEACECLRQYERLVRAKLARFARQRDESRRQAAARPRSLLREPEFKLRLPSLVFSVRQFIPRPRMARRPLMPQRNRRAAAAGRRQQQLASVAQELLLASKAGSPTAGNQLDLESRVVSHWHRFAGASQLRDSGQLQLLVTIQRATNLPMRIVVASPPRNQTPTGQANTRSSSPFSSQSLAALSSGQLGVLGSLQQQQQQQLLQSSAASPSFLVPPTSYVEVVVQQRQQATSLAQGNHPSWNETLFFPIDLSPAPDGHGGSQRLLVDEYLELNLYDYFLSSFETDDMGPPPMVDLDQQQQPPTMLVGGGGGESSHSLPSSDSNTGRRQPLAVGQHQRLERHLLGSLRVPLTTLLQNGRIEGSFCLSQPLFLDNYQLQFQDQPNNRGRPLLLLQPQPQQSAAEFGAPAAGPETFIDLFITLDPPITLAMPHFHLPTESYESDHVFEYAKLWEQTLARLWAHGNNNNSSATRLANQPSRVDRRTNNLTSKSLAGTSRAGRHVRALVLQKDAKYCLIIRLIGPLKPPDELLLLLPPAQPEDKATNESTSNNNNNENNNNDNNNISNISNTEEPNYKSPESIIRSLCRFVSLIQPLKHEILSLRELAPSVWFDSRQLVGQWLGGANEEKAMLLCNYLLYLGHCSAILLGDAIPDGRCVYVVIWREQTRFAADEGAFSDGRQASPLAAGPITSENFLARLPIVLSSRSVQLCDPNSGQIYSVGERGLPLASVGSLVTVENVYANVQPRESPGEISFDVRVRASWLPLFDGSSSPSQLIRLLRANRRMRRPMAASLSSNQQLQQQQQQALNKLESMRKSIGVPQLIQPIVDARDQLLLDCYRTFTRDECKQMELQLEKTIKVHLLRWRPSRPTYFNRTLSRLLADKLASFEDLLLNDQHDWRAKLADAIRNEILVVQFASTSSGQRRVFSWPVNLAFNSMKSVLNSLYASGVHGADLMMFQHEPSSSSINNNSAQFLVACHVRAYPARVLSVWLYVGAIVTNRRSV